MAIAIGSSVSAVLVIAGLAVGIVMQRRRVRSLAMNLAASASDTEKHTSTPSDFTSNMTRTQTAGSPTANFVLSIPGFMRLAADDFTMNANQTVGKGGFAIIYKGALSSRLQTSFGFTDVAVKVFKGSAISTGQKGGSHIC